MIEVSVIVPFYGEVPALRATLAALDAQTWPVDRRETLLVDNGSRGNLSVLRREFPGVHWLQGLQPGSYAARNRGLAHARGRVIAFTDADCVPDPAWLAEGMRALTELKATIVGGRIDYLDPVGRGLNVCESIEERFFLLGRQRFLIEKLNVAATANLIAERGAFGRVGGFDPGLKSFGDGDWTKRAVARGETLRYADAAIVRHPRRGEFEAIRRKWVRVAGGRISLLKRDRAGFGSLASALFTDSIFDPRIHWAALTGGGPGPGRRLEYFRTLERLSRGITRAKWSVLLGGEAERR